MTKELKLSDLYWGSIEPNTFHLSENQENAVAVILGAFSIRNLLGEFSDPMRGESNQEIAETIALEAIKLALAAVRGDFWTKIWPHIIRRFELDDVEKEIQTRNAQLATNSRRGVDARRKGSAEKEGFCYEYVRNYRQQFRTIAEAIKATEAYINEKKLWPKETRPKPRTIRKYIEPLFPTRRRKRSISSV